MLCTVFANLNDGELTEEQTTAISRFVRYLLYTENVKNFIIVNGRNFEEEVIEAIYAERDELLRVYVSQILPEESLYRVGWDKRRKEDLDSAFPTFTICDSTTKDIVLSGIDEVAYIVEKPDAGIYIIAKRELGFRF